MVSGNCSTVRGPGISAEPKYGKAIRLVKNVPTTTMKLFVDCFSSKLICPVRNEIKQTNKRTNKQTIKFSDY